MRSLPGGELPSSLMAETASQTLDQQLEELGAQLAWVREYL
jgi:hypothetical protein